MKSSCCKICKKNYISGLLILPVFFFVGICILLCSAKIFKLGKTRNTGGAVSTNIINWENEYPFFEKDIIERQAITHKLQTKVNNIESRIDSLVLNYFPFYYSILEVGNGIEKVLNWKIPVNNGYDSAVDLGDGYYTNYVRKINTEKSSESIIEFSEYCKKSEFVNNFVYVQAPYKIGQAEKNSELDYSNKNADTLLKNIQSKINYLDLRDRIKLENLNNRDLFYKTDHHWKTESTLWATKEIVSYLTSELGMQFPESVLEEDNFTYNSYESVFLGSIGKKLTKAKAKPDDFTVILPKKEVQLKIIQNGYEKSGTFSSLYDYSQLKNNDLYNSYPYDGFFACNVGILENQVTDNKNSILIIGDSFTRPLAAFLSLICRKVERIDLAGFTGSIRKYIEKNGPYDAVIVLYNPASIIEPNLENHTSSFDFR